ncbi:MAG: hypothetical protein WC976_06585 [Caldisericia bacterium]
MSIKLYAKMYLGFTSISPLLKEHPDVKKPNPVYVKKIWSLNPTKHKFIPLPEALKKYDEYLTVFVESRVRDLTEWKSFEDWLATEI